MTALIILVFLLGLMSIGCVIGWWATRLQQSSERAALRSQARAVQEQWDGLHRAQQVTTAFWEARQALRAEALRQHGLDREPT